MANFIVIYDTCILYPLNLRTLFVELAMTGLFQAKWTNDINNELAKALLTKNPKITKEQVGELLSRLASAVPDYLVTGYENLIPTLSLDDKKDRHVLAAAIRCSAQAIITNNLKDFPEDAVNKYDIEALDPDTFIGLQFDLSQEKVISAIKRSRHWMNPVPSPKDYLQGLMREGLIKTVAILRDWQDLI